MVTPLEFDFLHETMPGMAIIAPSAITIKNFDTILFIFPPCLLKFHLVSI